MKVIYKNITNDFQVIGNNKDIIKSGTETECMKYYENMEPIENTKYKVIQIVGPDEKIETN